MLVQPKMCTKSKPDMCMAVYHVNGFTIRWISIMLFSPFETNLI